MTIQPSGAFTPEEYADVLAYNLATNAATAGVEWILGDVGMGKPARLPFGYITVFGEAVRWSTMQGGTGGLATGGNRGLDDWDLTVILTVAFQSHDYFPPGTATPPANSPVLAVLNGAPVPYQEQPGWRLALQLNEQVKAALRSNPTNSGIGAASRVTESRYLLQNIDGSPYRACRITLSAQQRRPRGN